LRQLHSQFKDADILGSLIDPRQATNAGTLLAISYEELEPLLQRALAREATHDPTAAVFGHQVAGVAKAAHLLGRNYTLVATNPPFLGRAKQNETLMRFTAEKHFDA